MERRPAQPLAREHGGMQTASSGAPQQLETGVVFLLQTNMR